jgi:hypothetical protein
MAEKLIRVAAQREMVTTEKLSIPENYSENDEQSESISLATQEDDFPITAVVKEKENNNINEINNKV